MVNAFAPVNIAWIKYMGKTNGVPTNASFSMTLSDAGTTTFLRSLEESGELHFVWSPAGYVPPQSGQKKAEFFLKNERIWREAFASFGLSYVAPTGLIEIETRNSVPAGTGIATSASGYAALTLAWIGYLSGKQFPEWRQRFEADSAVRKQVAALAGQGSGSACRSIDGPFVEWDPRLGTHEVDPGGLVWIDYILLLDEIEKKVSSSEAHVRVQTSPKFSGRVGRAHARLAQVKEALKKKNFEVLAEVVLSEALDMHELFTSAVPPFEYQNEQSKLWIEKFRTHAGGLPSRKAVVTLDAGANVHVFVPESEERLWDRYFQAQEGLKFLKSKSGTGAYYAEG